MTTAISTWNAAFADRRVLVTGHTGFKGNWLTLWLREIGAHVGGLALAPDDRQQRLYEAFGGSRGLAYELIGDIREPEVCDRAISEFEPHLIIHMAAQPLVRASYELPVDTFATNVMGTIHVLDAARKRDDLLGVVVVTTDKCYENREQIWPYRESDPMGGHDPYSASKGAAEIAVSAYARSFFEHNGSSDVATVRSGNVIGGGDYSADRLFPDLVRAISNGSPLSIRSPEAVRPWQHVLEPLSGYLELGVRMLNRDGPARGAWNFGPYPHDAETVRGMLAHVEANLGRRFPAVIIEDAPQPHEASLLMLDITKAEVLLGWHPVLDNRERVVHALQWYLAALDRSADVLQLATEQIRLIEGRLIRSEPGAP